MMTVEDNIFKYFFQMLNDCIINLIILNVSHRRHIEDNTGLGNLLIFFPAAYFFAAFTSRDIIIYDESAFGAMCKAIQCGFPLVSELVNVHPEELKWQEVTFLKRINWKAFDLHVSGAVNHTEIQIGPYGFQSKSDWWAYNNVTSKCVRDITGCHIGDVACSERYAMQRLIMGPFLSNSSTLIEKQIQNFPEKFKRSLTTVRHQYFPRIDISIHLRNQFYHFEGGNRNGSDREYVDEVREWFNSTECDIVYQMIKNQIIDIIYDIKPHLLPKSLNYSSISSNSEERRRKLVSGSSTVHNLRGHRRIHKSHHFTKVNDADKSPITIYLATDNELVKRDLCQYLNNSFELQGIIQVLMRVTDVVVHSKFIVAKSTPKEIEFMRKPMVELAFDFYFMSLSNHLIAWRKGNSLSTFVHAAQKVSGTKELTNINTWSGIGTKGYHLKPGTGPNGDHKVEMFTTYPNF